MCTCHPWAGATYRRRATVSTHMTTSHMSPFLPQDLRRRERLCSHAAHGTFGLATALDSCLPLIMHTNVFEMSVKELKAEVRRLGLDARGCIEKADFVALVSAGVSAAPTPPTADAPSSHKPLDMDSLAEHINGGGFDMRCVQSRDGALAIYLGTPSDEEIAQSCWGPCIWGDDGAVELMEFALLLAGHPLPNDLASIRLSESPEEIAQGRFVFTRGVHHFPSLAKPAAGKFAGHSKAQFMSIYHLIDNTLSAEDMNQLTSSFSGLLQNLKEMSQYQLKLYEEPSSSACFNMMLTNATRWALLCMHVGAEVPPQLLCLAFLFFDPEEGLWHNTPERKAFSILAAKEIGVYSAGSPLQFVRETLMDSTSNGGTRFIDNDGGRHGYHGEEGGAFSRRRDVLHSCAACNITDSGASKKCSGCNMRYYCSTACQKEHWKTGGHKHECAELKNTRPNKMADVLGMMTLNDKEDYLTFLIAMGMRESYLKKLAPLLKKKNEKQHKRRSITSRSRSNDM